MTHDIHAPRCKCGHYKHDHQTDSLRDWEGRCYRCSCQKHDAPATRTGAKASETDDLDGTETTP